MHEALGNLVSLMPSTQSYADQDSIATALNDYNRPKCQLRSLHKVHVACR